MSIQDGRSEGAERALSSQHAETIRRYYAARGFNVEVAIEPTRYSGKDGAAVHSFVTWGARIVTPIECLPRRLRDMA